MSPVSQIYLMKNKHCFNTLNGTVWVIHRFKDRDEADSARQAELKLER